MGTRAELTALSHSPPFIGISSEFSGNATFSCRILLPPWFALVIRRMKKAQNVFRAFCEQVKRLAVERRCCVVFGDNLFCSVRQSLGRGQQLKTFDHFWVGLSAHFHAQAKALADNAKKIVAEH